MDYSLADEETQDAEIVDRAMRRINTCLPGIITAFDAATQRVTVQPAIQMVKNLGNAPVPVNLPPTVNVPLVFPIALTAGFALTLPVSVGDACLLLFSQKAIDNWVEFGGVQPPAGGLGLRHHSITDAFAILAPVPNPGVLGNYDTDGISIRNAAGTQKIKLRNADIVLTSGSAVLTMTESSGAVEITAPGGLTLPENTTVTGTLTVNGNINYTGSLTHT